MVFWMMLFIMVGMVVFRLVFENMICGDLLFSFSVMGMWFLVVVCIIVLFVFGDFVNDIWLILGCVVSVVFVLWL